MDAMAHDVQETLITLTSDIVAAHVSNNDVAVDQVPTLISTVYTALKGLGGEVAPVEERPEPAVSIRSSIKPDYIVCLEDGKKLKMLKRYLRTNFNMTPEEYRARWGLPDPAAIADAEARARAFRAAARQLQTRITYFLAGLSEQERSDYA